MKTMLRMFCIVLAGACLSTTAFGEEYETNITFPRITEPGVLRIASGEGDITVTGHDRNEVIIVSNSEMAAGETDPNDERARGLRRISSSSFSIGTDEDENAIVINRSMQNETDLEIRVPRQTSVYIGAQQKIKLNSYDAQNLQQSIAITQRQAAVAQDQARAESEERAYTTGTENVYTVTVPNVMSMDMVLPNFLGGGILVGDITISNITGDMEISTIEGDIRITGVNGSIIASSVDGDIEAELVRLTGDKPLSFSTVDGFIDVTLPRSIQADVQLKSSDGEIFTNFNIDITPVKPDQNVQISGYASSDLYNFVTGIGQSINGTINGGGRNLTLKTVDGNIYFKYPQ